MSYKFEKLEVWQLAIEYIDLVYEIVEKLPRTEDYNLRAQAIRAATSIALNTAEGSTSQSDAEQSRFIGMAVRSLIESVACLHLIRRRKYVDSDISRQAYEFSERLFAKLQAFRKYLKS
jgi:four helix bundle protein